MQLSIRINGGDTTPAARRNLAETVDNALSKFANHLRHVTLSVSDVNGPRGGKDKLCRCVLHMKRAQPVVIEDLDFSLAALSITLLNAPSTRSAKRVAKFGSRRR